MGIDSLLTAPLYEEHNVHIYVGLSHHDQEGPLDNRKAESRDGSGPARDCRRQTAKRCKQADPVKQESNYKIAQL